MQNHVPLIIHSRGAEDECFSIVNHLFYAKASKSKQTAINKQPRVLFHSFTGDLDAAEDIFEKGCS